MNAPADHRGIAQVEVWLGKTLPKSYRELMLLTNGLEGFARDDYYVMLWAIEDIINLNIAYTVNEFAPGLLLIGSDGSATGIALDSRAEPMPVVEASFIGLSHHTSRGVARSFDEFLTRLIDAPKPGNK